MLEKLTELEAVRIQQAGGLQVFGLRWPAGDGLDYATLDEALRDKILEVMEINEGGQVRTIKVVNKSDRMVFLMAGELLVGCKQDRVLNTSMIVPARTEMPIPVACVEAGRWGYRSRKFGSARSSSHSYLRMMLARQTYTHYRVLGEPSADQGAIWAEVGRKMSEMGSSSASAALHDVFQDYGERLDQVLQSLPAPDGCHGAAFAVNGNIVGADLFDKSATLNKLWPKLLKGYAIDALEDAREKAKLLEPESVTGWLKKASSAKHDCFDSPGLGQAVRIEGDELVGAALVVDQQPIHVELFREEKK
jgi:hypothetical protein